MPPPTYGATSRETRQMRMSLRLGIRGARQHAPADGPAGRDAAEHLEELLGGAMVRFAQLATGGLEVCVVAGRDLDLDLELMGRGLELRREPADDRRGRRIVAAEVFARETGVRPAQGAVGRLEALGVSRFDAL